MQLEQYDPTLIRQVPLPEPSYPLPVKTTHYVVVGRGAAPELHKWRCVRQLTPAQRRRFRTGGLLFLQAITTSGPSFCFIQRFDHGPITLGATGLCSTFDEASHGYALTEIDHHEQRPSFYVVASLVPDGVAKVILVYRHHRPIRASVVENAYWARVPRSPQIATQPVRPSRLRQMILNDLPTKITWFSADGREVQAFTPPAAYVQRLMHLDQGCIAAHCGA